MKKFDGHINIGKQITIYGDIAMHYTINMWYFYLSPNATPWAATYAKGPGLRVSDKNLAPVRKTLFGHNFNTEKNGDALYELNNTYSEACTFFDERLGRKG